VFAEALADVLDSAWYCDFHSEDETFVVFADRVFRYPRGDNSGRESARTTRAPLACPRRKSTGASSRFEPGPSRLLRGACGPEWLPLPT
jgi:hypothetical protein